MATLLSSLETQVRRHLNEATASFWTSAELIDIANNGIKDLWRPIVDLKQEHFLVIDSTNVSLASSTNTTGTTTLTGVPEAAVHKIYLIEPRDLSENSSNKGLIFVPKDFNHPWFRAARGVDPVDPSNNTIYYAMTGAGAPIDYDSTPPDGVNFNVQVAPQVNATVNLTLVYVPVLRAFTASEEHPIPGEADQALVNWMVAWARAKERDDASPDPSWLAAYRTEKQNLLSSLGLRQLQEPEYVDAIFEEYWS